MDAQPAGIDGQASLGYPVDGSGEGCTMVAERILVLDDEALILRSLKRSLERFALPVDLFAEPNAALAALRGPARYAVVVTDYNLPELNGLQFADQARRLQPCVAIVLISGMLDLGLAQDAINQHGVRHVLVKPWKDAELVAVIEQSLAHYQDQRLHQELAQVAQQHAGRAAPIASLADLIADNRRGFTDGLIDVLGFRDTETKSHSRRVAAYAVRLGEQLGINGGQREGLELGALLHDIGKMGIPDGILLKPGKLSDAEWAVMRRHPAIGLSIIERIEWLRGAAEIVSQHHERFDGGGYPASLAGEAISVQARIFAVVDTLDAMTSDRPYRQRLPYARAVEVITAEAGRQFDPAVVAAFLAVDRTQWEAIRVAHEDSASELRALGVEAPALVTGFLDG